MSSDSGSDHDHPGDGPIDFSDHQFIQFDAGSDARKRCQRLLKMGIGKMRTIDWALLETLGESDRAREIVGTDTPWDRLFDLAAQPTHRELVVEFLSTFIYRPRPAGAPEPMEIPGQPAPEPEVEFFLFGQRQEMSLAQFAVHTGLYTEMETATPLYTDAVALLPLDDLKAWWPHIGDGPFGKKARVSSIRDPLYRYLHRCIATSIAPRGKSCEWVNHPDLFYLYSLLTGRRCALATCLAQFFASAYRRQTRGTLYVGSYITVIARSCGRYFPFVHDLLPEIGFRRMDKATVVGMKIVDTFPGVGLRFIGDDGHIFVPQPLPPPIGIQAEEVQVVEEAEPHQPEPEVEEPVQDQPVPEPPQYPRHTYQAVRLPARTHDAIETIMRRQDRHEDLLMFLIESEQERRVAAGLPLRRLPAERQYPVQGGGDAGASGSGGDAGVSGSGGGPGPRRVRPRIADLD